MNLKKALDDIAVAELLLSPVGNPTNDEGLYDLASYHIQQGIEKAIKYLLETYCGMDETSKRFRKHDIGALIDLLENEHHYTGIIISQEIKERASDISDWEANSRYNSDLGIEKEEMVKAVSLFHELYQDIVSRESEKEEKLD